jgi:hypothetical protein
MRRFAMLVLLLAACGENERRCIRDEECVSKHGDFGLCLDDHCAYKDDSCTGGYKFEDAAGSQANMCVSASEVSAHKDAGVVGVRDAPTGG